MDATTDIITEYAAATDAWFHGNRADAEERLNACIARYADVHGISEADAEARLIDATAR